MERARAKANITGHRNLDHDANIYPPWSVEVPKSGGTPITEIPDTSGKLRIDHIKPMVGSNGFIVYTDGSANPQAKTNPSYGIVTLDYRGHQISTNNGKLHSGKSILDAETYAIYHVMELTLDRIHDLGPLTYPSIVVIMSDSTGAINSVIRPSNEGPLAYLNHQRSEIETHLARNRTIFKIGWVKGHSKDLCNDKADKLAKTATHKKDPMPWTTYSM